VAEHTAPAQLSRGLHLKDVLTCAYHRLQDFNQSVRAKSLEILTTAGAARILHAMCLISNVRVAHCDSWMLVMLKRSLRNSPLRSSDAFEFGDSAALRRLHGMLIEMCMAVASCGISLQMPDQVAHSAIALLEEFAALTIILGGSRPLEIRPECMALESQPSSSMASSSSEMDQDDLPAHFRMAAETIRNARQIALQDAALHASNDDPWMRAIDIEVIPTLMADSRPNPEQIWTDRPQDVPKHDKRTGIELNLFHGLRLAGLLTKQDAMAAAHAIEQFLPTSMGCRAISDSLLLEAFRSAHPR